MTNFLDISVASVGLDLISRRADGREIGYVPARHAVWVAEILDRGCPLTITVAAIKRSGDARLPDIYLDNEVLTDEDD